MRILTVPNIITFVRAGMLGAFWYLIHTGDVELGLSVFFISWALDGVDGYIARSFGQVSQLGSYLDKIIDRFTMAFGVIVFLRYGLVPAYALLLFTREYGTLPVIYPAADLKHNWKGAGVLGKITTLGEGVGLLWLALGLPFGAWVVAIVAVVGALTAFSYLRQVFVVVALLAFALPAHAAGVALNEIMWDGDEYIELINTDTQDVSLENWKLTRQQEGGAEKTIIVFSADATIAGDGYFLIEKNEAATTIPADAIPVPVLALVNTGELVRLYNDSNIVIDTAGQLGPWPAGENTDTGVSMERVGNGWQTSTEISGGRNGTPRAANSAVVLASPEISPSPTNSTSPSPAAETEFEVAADEVFETAVVINEFLPNPIGDDVAGEFIELYNPSEEDSDLSGWQIDDQDGGSKPYTLPAESIISAHEYAVFHREETGIALNNTGDAVRLIDPDGVVHVDVTYSETIPEGSSINRDESGNFVQSTTVTEGEKNNITQPTPTPSATAVVASTKTRTKATSITKATQEMPIIRTVKVFRLLPNPVGADAEGEFIELKNIGTDPVDVSGWEVDDAEGGSRPYTIPAGTIIEAGAILTLAREETGIALNNTNDEVRLFAPDGTLVDSFSYGATKEGQILNAQTGGFVEQSVSATSAVAGASKQATRRVVRQQALTVDESTTSAASPKTIFTQTANMPANTNPFTDDRRRGMLIGIMLLGVAAVIGIMTFDGNHLTRELEGLAKSLGMKTKFPKSRADLA